MGVCYSVGVKGDKEDEEEDNWWKRNSHNHNSKINGSRRTVIELKLKKNGSSAAADLASLITKYGGAGAPADERALLEIPGRLFANGATSTSSLYTQQGKKGTNQDAMLVWENFSSRSDTVFCGVFDGHGPYGHMVARKVRDSLPLLLHNQWEANSNGDQNAITVNKSANGCTHFGEFIDEDLGGSLEVEGNEKLPEMYLPLKQSILSAFKSMDKELKLNPTLDCFCSGTTAVTLVKQGMDLIIGNVGDSRAVLATRDKDNSLTALQLTVDLKPNLPREAARIQQCKGRVFALQDEPEVARVWLPNSDSPGLAMARAFGDFCLKDFGLISVPDVYYRQITKRDEFVILATDGVWDVLSNKEAVDVVALAPGRATAARALVDCATRAWRLKYPTSKNDDCAVVCLFLEHVSGADAHQTGSELTNSPGLEEKQMSIANGDTDSLDVGVLPASQVTALEHSDTINESSEIVPVLESEEKLPGRSLGQSKRSLAECLSTAEDEEWSALEGITRVNSLLSLPRFLSSDKVSASWRKWL